MVLCSKIYVCAYITFIFIIILDDENVVVDKTFFSLLCIRLEILKNIYRDILFGHYHAYFQRL